MEDSAIFRWASLEGLWLNELWSEGVFRVLRGLYRENGSKKSQKVTNFCLKNLSSPGKRAKNGYILFFVIGLWHRFKYIFHLNWAILKISIFWPFLGGHKVKIWQKSAFFDLPSTQNWSKNRKFQNRSVQMKNILETMPLTYL